MGFDASQIKPYCVFGQHYTEAVKKTEIIDIKDGVIYKYQGNSCQECLVDGQEILEGRLEEAIREQNTIFASNNGVPTSSKKHMNIRKREWWGRSEEW